MQFFDSLKSIPAGFGPTAVTFGKFDGMHVGHRHVLDALFSVANERGLEPAAITFDRNPLSLLAPERCPEAIASNDQKRELFERTGLGTLVQLPFDPALSSMTAQEFVRRVLVDALDARVVLVGPGTRFGAGGKGDFALLTRLGAELGFDVRQLEPRLDDGAGRVSSTRIRELLADGDVAEAGRLLGRHPSVRSMVVHGQRRGRALGYPTANLSPQLEGFIPADGVYAGRLTVDGVTMPAAISIGNNPTFEGVPERQVEAHVLDEDLDLYDRIVELEFVDRIRGMAKFDSLDELIAQMGQDTLDVRGVLARANAAG